jgi:hypothetical protein
MKARMRQFSMTAFVVGGFVLVSLPARSQDVSDDLTHTRHWSGETVQPVFEGFDENEDGSFNMWFGYLNRNYREELDIPVGPENSFAPGPADRGQPSHFIPRRNKDIFKIVVPKDFQGPLTWTLVSHGKTLSVAGKINQVFMIDRRFTTRGGNDTQITSNTPPIVSITPMEASTSVGTPVVFNVSAKDDGLPAKRGQYALHGEPIGMTLEWTKFRGPGGVEFNPAENVMGRWSKKIVDGKAQTTVTFAEPGEYVLQAVVDDGSRGNYSYHCCWTNTEVKVTVKGSSSSTAQR